MRFFRFTTGGLLSEYHDLGDPASGRPVELHLTFSTHTCCKCGKHFTIDFSKIADPKSLYTKAVVDLAVRLVVEDRLPLRSASWDLWRNHRVLVPFSTIERWIDVAGKKKEAILETEEYFHWAFEHFSGYISIDEVYDGRFTILFLVDANEGKTLIFRPLEHAPEATDILEILNTFQKILADRGLDLYGVTTDGSKLYEETTSSVFPGVRHQLCEFHTKRNVTRAILKGCTKIRRDLEKTKTKRTKRGRPSSATEKKEVQKNARIQTKIGELFKNRFLFVRKRLTPCMRKTLKRITWGLPELRRLRCLTDAFYRLYDRRCRTKTAMDELRRLRRRANRLKSSFRLIDALKSPMIEGSLRFLDDKRCPSTSNSVERCNHVFRKLQKSIYRVRTLPHIRARIAMDMFCRLHTITPRSIATTHDFFVRRQASA